MVAEISRFLPDASVLLLLSAWLPFLGWLILPVFGLFLMMQLLRWLVPARSERPPAAERVESPAPSERALTPPP